jgi:serine/threonine protein phosphatase 1
LWWRYEHFLFVHAGIENDIPMREQNPSYLLWERHASPGQDGIIHVVGHHPTKGEPYFEPGRYNLDTGAVYGQTLTACEVLTRQFWQVS